MTANEVGAWLAIATFAVGVPLNLYVVGKLFRLWRADPAIHVLRERLIVAVAVLVVVVVFGLIFLNNDQPIPPLDTGSTKVITRAAILALALVPALYWLRIYRGAER